MTCFSISTLWRHVLGYLQTSRITDVYLSVLHAAVARRCHRLPIIGGMTMGSLLSCSSIVCLITTLWRQSCFLCVTISCRKPSLGTSWITDFYLSVCITSWCHNQIYLLLVKCWASVADGGPTLHRRVRDSILTSERVKIFIVAVVP